jgi:uncharacterized protein (TIGR00251 family)
MSAPRADSREPHVVQVRVIPRAGRTAVAGTRGGAILIRLAAAPVDGAANAALIELLAGIFNLPKRAITVVAGHTSRDKRVAIEGLTAAEVEAKLSAILAS